jgi:hypothetical protein
MEGLQLMMRQCVLYFAHPERAPYVAEALFGKPHDRPLAFPSVAPQPHEPRAALPVPFLSMNAGSSPCGMGRP